MTLGRQRRIPRLSAEMMGLSRREFLALAGTAAAGVLLSACTGRAPLAGLDPEEHVQLVYQDWRSEWFPAMAQQMLGQFHDEFANIRVFYTPDPDNFQEAMLDDLRAGTAADVFQGCCTHLPTWAQMGYTLDLRPYVAADLERATIDDWDPAQYRALIARDGHQFALPKYHGALALYYNRDLFDQYGVDYPGWTWTADDYLTAMRQLTRDRGAGKGGQLWGSMIDISWDRIQVYVNGWGGHFVAPDDPRRCLMAEPEAMAAMEWLRDRIWRDHVMASTLDVQNMATRQAFISQKVAMVEDGSWALKDILESADFRVGVAPLPAWPAQRATLATTDGFAIYSGTQHPEAAWELLKFLIGRDYGRAMIRANLLQPARASLIEDWQAVIRDEYPGRLTGSDIAAFADGHVKGYSVTTEVFANMAESKKITYAAWDDIFKLGRAPVSRMREVSRQIEAIQGG